MKSIRNIFYFAIRLFPVFLFLSIAAPYSLAQQNDNRPPARNSTPKGPGNADSPDTKAPRSDGQSNATATGRRGSSSDPQSGRGSANENPRRGGGKNVSPERPGRSIHKPGDQGTANNGRGSRGPSPSPQGSRDSWPAGRNGRGSSNAGTVRGGTPNGANGNSPRNDSGSASDQPGRQGRGDDKNNSGIGRPDRPTRGSSGNLPANGAVIGRGNNGQPRTVTTPRGAVAQTDGRGRVTTIRDKNGNTISRGPRGERRVETVRPDRTRVVSFGNRGGFVERPFNRDGRQYLRRTYVVGGHSYANLYRGHYYHGRPYYVYLPHYYYSPAYYRWMFGYWPRPVHYGWNWYASPWYRPYGYYFAPYPVYSSASLWLTDYLLAENLRMAYETEGVIGKQLTGSQGQIIPVNFHPYDQTKDQKNSAVLTPETKEMIADEVKSVIAEQEASASSSARNSKSEDEVPAALDSRHRVFVVFSVLEADTGGGTCSLTSSDVVKRIEDTPDINDTVAVQVLASKNSDCAIGSRVRIEVTDLNEMQNHLREQVDAGVKILAEKQGKDGLPAAPAPSPRSVQEGIVAPDPEAAAELQKQQHEADRTEKEVKQQTASVSGSGN